MKIFFPLVLVLSTLTLVISLSLIHAHRYIYIAAQHFSYKVGINLNNIAQNSYVAWIKSLPPNYQSKDEPIFLNQKLSIYYQPEKTEMVLGESNPDDSKWIEIDLSEQRLYLKENGTTVNSFLVSTGKWAPTPAGQWRIWTKLTSTRMVGGSKALGTYYNLPNVPYVMYYDRGYAVHGAYWHNNFGQPMSHGCTNMRPEEAKIVFDWAQVGTRVIVHQ